MNPRWITRKRIDRKYESFVRGHKCSVKGCNGKSEAHHVFKRNDSYGCIPLCERHHKKPFATAYHTLGYDKFEQAHSLNIMWVIYELLSEYIYEKLGK